MLNLIWLFSPNFVFQSCQTPLYCNYTFLYHSILEALRYVLIYNRLHLSKTLPHENLHDVKGYGLGLYYVKCMMQKLDGTIDIESEPNVGTTVKLIFERHE